MLGLAVATWLSMAPTEPPATTDLQLQWSAPDECPKRSAVEARFAHYVGDETAVAITAEADIVASGEGYRLDLTVSGHPKTLRSKSCDELADAAAVIMSIAATTPEALAEATSTPEPLPTEPPPPEVDPPPVVADATPTPPAVDPPPDFHPRRVRGSLRVEGGFRFGVMPAFGADTSLAAGLVWPSARVEVAGTLWTPRDQILSPSADIVALATLGSVEARGCWTPHRRRLEVPLCAGFELGAARVDARGSAPRSVDHGLWAGASASAAVVWLLRPNVGLWFGPEAVIALRRPRFEVAGLSYRPGPAAIRAFFGVELRFP